MNPFVFSCLTRIIFGEHMAATAADVCKEYGGNKALIVTDEILFKKGHVAGGPERLHGR